MASMNLNEKLKLIRRNFIHATGKTKVRELHQQLENLIQSNFWESLLSDININYIKYLARVHGLPCSFSSLLVNALQETTYDIRHKLKLIQVVKYAVNHCNDFIDISPLLEVLLKQFTIESLGSHDDFFNREMVSQLLLVIIMLSNPDKIDKEKIPKSSLHALQSYMPYVNAKYKSRIKSSLERFGFWQNLDGSGGLRVSGTITASNQSVKTGFQVIQSAHKQNMAKNGSKVQAHVVKTQQTEAVTTEENVSQKTQMRSISLANALEDSRTKSRSVAANQSIELNTAERAGGSDRCWWKTTSTEVTNFLKKAKDNGTISDDDIKYLRNTYGGFKFSFSQGDLTIKNMIGEIFSKIAKNQNLDLRGESDATTVNILLESVTSKNVINKVFDILTFRGNYPGHIKSVLEATQFHCARSGRVTNKTKELLEKIRDQSGCPDQIKNIVWYILSSRDDCLEQNFEHSLNILKSGPDQAEVALEYISRQTIIESKCEEISKKFDFIPILVNVVVSEGVLYSESMLYTPKAVQIAVEIIESYLSMDFNTGLSATDVNKLTIKFQEKGVTDGSSATQKKTSRFDFIKKWKNRGNQSSENFDVTNKIIRCLLKTLDKNKDNPSYFKQLPALVLECLMEASVSHPDLTLQAFVLAGLVNIMNNEDVYQLVVKKLDNVELLIPKLFRKDLIYFDGRVCLEENLEKNFGFNDEPGDVRGYVCISAVVARLLLITFEPSKYNDNLTTQVSQCLHTHPDNQTRIYCSEYLFTVAKSGISLNPIVNCELREHCHDSTPDVHVYCTAAYCTSMSNLILYNQGDIPSDQLNSLAEIYSLNRVLLGKKDFTSWINTKIIDILHHVSSSVQFTDEMFQVLAQCLNKSAEDNDAESLKTVQKVLQTFEFFCTKNAKAKAIPSYCIETIENLLLESDVFDELCAKIIECCMIDGRWVSDQVLEEFDKYLIYTSDTSIPFIRRLFLANNNQELPDQIFDDFQMELIGLRLLQTVTEQDDNFLQKNYLDKADPVELLECLVGYLSRGRVLSPINVFTIAECLKETIYPQLVVQSLTLASSNGQSLSKEIIGLALQLESINWSSKIELATAVIGCNQLLPDDFLLKIYQSFISGEDTYGSVQLIIALIQNNYLLPIEVLHSLCNVALNKTRDKTDEHCLTSELLSALIRLVGSNFNDDGKIVDFCKQIFMEAMKNPNETLMKLSLHGLENLSNEVLTTAEVDRIQQYASTQGAKFSPQHIANSKSSDKVMLQEATDDDCFIEIILNHLDACMDNDEQEVLRLDMNSRERLQEILSADKSKLSDLGSKLSLKFEEQLPSKLTELYSDLLDTICFATVNSKSSEVVEIGSEVLKQAANAGIKVSTSSETYLKFTSSNGTSLQNPKSEAKLNEEYKLRNLIACYMTEPENSTLASKIGKCFQGVSTGMCLQIIELLSKLRPEESSAIPNILSLIQDYVHKEKSDTISQCVYIMKPNRQNDYKNHTKELIQAGALFLLEGIIKCSNRDNIEAINLYLELQGTKSAVPENSCKDCVYFAIEHFADLSWRNQLISLSIVASRWDERCVEILLEYLANEKNSAIKGVVYCALESLSENVKIHSDHRWIACTKELYERIFAEIYKEGEDVENLNEEMTTMLLTSLYSTQFWDLFPLRTTTKSEWMKHIVISDAVERFAQSENEKLEMYPMLQTLLANVVKRSTVFVGVWTLFDKFQDYTSIPMLIELFNEFTEDGIIDLLEILQLSEDEDQRLIQIQTVGLAKKLIKKCSNLSDNASIMFAYSLLQALDYDISLAVELVTSVSVIESCFDIKHFLEFVVQRDIKYDLPCSIRKLRNVADHQRNLNELKVLMELEFLQTEIPKSYTKRIQLESNLKTLLRRGYSKAQLQVLLPHGKMSEASRQYLGDDKYVKYLDVVENIIVQVTNYEIKPRKFEEISKMTQLNDQSQWIKQCNNVVTSSVFSATGSKGQKRVKEIIVEFLEKWQRETKISHESEAVNDWKELIESIQQCKKESELLPSESSICNWDASVIYMWSQLFQQTYPPGHRITKKDAIFAEMLMVAKQAYVVWKNLHLTSIQILSLIVTVVSDKGQLLQVATGSGKSTIIAVIALMQALQGIKVDIYTSSPVLAERDSKEWAEFYKMFDLTCDHNGDTGSGYTRGEKSCYTKHIVYGETSQFQFDTLRDEYSGLSTRAKRGYGYSIVDEVDSMFIDDSSKLARLSSTLPGMDLIQILYHVTWERLHYIQSHLLAVGDYAYYLEGRFEDHAYEFVDENANVQRIDQVDFYISQNQANAKGLSDAKIYKIDNNEEMDNFVAGKLKDYLQTLIDGDVNEDKSSKISKIDLPQNLREFAKTQIDNWVESALTAITFQENIHYIVDENLIKPVDFATTGVIQSSTNWNNGLHQFLQIKHSLKISSETVTTNFLSNMAIFQKYGSKIVGFTGTLGSDYGKSVLEQVYNVSTIVIPELYFKRFYRLPDVVATNEFDWLQNIVHSALNEAARKRGVLIISQTIKQAEQISEEIFRQKTNISIKLYVRNDQRQEKQVERIRPGDIIIATNLAGRGTDIKTPEIEEFGGMHVIVTFLPESLRVEEQAFGRTSRQGKQGTGQLIVFDPLMTCSMELIQRRDDRETAILKDFVDKQLKLIQTKDKLFKKFSACFLAKRKHLRKYPINSYAATAVVKSAFGCENLTALELTHLQAIEEKWALFLKNIDDGRLSADKAESEYNKFEKKINDNFKKQDRTIRSANNCFYWIQYGNEWYRLDSNLNSNATKAYDYFQEAIKQDASFSAAAYVGQAYVLLKGRLMSHEDDYKTKAVNRLRTALKLLYEEMGVHTVAQTFLQQRTQRSDSDLFTQLTTKVNLLGTYTRHIEGIISTTEKSLRRVLCTGISSEQEQKTFIPNNKPNLLPFNKNFEAYHLHFNNLTSRYDSGTIDQAKRTIDSTSPYLSDETMALKLSNQNLPDILKNLTKVPILVEFGSLVDIHSVIKIVSALKTKFFSLLVSGSLTTLEKIASLPSLKNNQILIEYVDPNDDKITQVKHIKNNNKKIRQLLPKGLKQCKLTIVFKKPNMDELEKLLNSFGDLVSFAVEIDEPNRSAISENWEELLQYHGNKLNFVELNSTTAKKYITEIREKNIEFVLCFQNVQEREALTILENADREQEEIKQTELKEMFQQYSSDCIPLDELRELAQRGIVFIATFNERTFIPWRSVIAVGILASVQIGAGAVLISTGFGATVGLGLITEGMADFTTAGMAITSRNFDWTNYAKQKAVSMTISVVSMGLSNLKDGAKGVQTLAQGTLSEAGEQAGTKLLMNGKSIGQTIKITSKNLKNLACKQIAVQAGENVARAGLNALVDSVVKFSFDQVKIQIENSVDSSFKLHFYGDKLQKEFKQFHGVNSVVRNDKKYTTTAVMKWVNETTNPQSSYWSKQWDAVGWPLCRGILSDPKYLGSPFSLLTRAVGIVNGMREIVTIVDNVCAKIRECLMKANESTTVEFLLRCKFHLSDSDAKLLAKLIIFQNPRTFEVQTYPSEKDLVQFEEKVNKVSLSTFFKNINSSIVNYKPDTMELSPLRKSIVDAISAHIIHTADRQLISPISTYAVGSIVANVSQQIQSRLLVSEEQYTPEQKENKKKADELLLKPQDRLTADEKTFLQQYRTPTTFREQIMTNADAHNIAYQQRDIIIQAENQVNSEESNENPKISQETLKDIVNIAADGPADTATIMMLSKQNNLNVKIVDDPDYVPTQQEIDAGVEIIVYQKPSNDSKVGHYLYKDKNTGELVEFIDDGGNKNNCAYNILGHLSGKSASELRCDAASLILKNPKQYENVQESKRWIESRFPLHAKNYLGVGGARKKSPEELGVQNVKSRYIKRRVGGKNYKLISKISGKIKINGEEGTKPQPSSVIRKSASDMSKNIKEGKCDFRFTEDGKDSEPINLGGGLVAGHVFNQKFGGLGEDENLITKTSSFNRTYNVEFEEPMKIFIAKIRTTFPDSNSTCGLDCKAGPYGTLDAIDRETGMEVSSIPLCKNLFINISYSYVNNPNLSNEENSRREMQERHIFDEIFEHLKDENGGHSATFTNTGSSDVTNDCVNSDPNALSSDEYYNAHG